MSLATYDQLKAENDRLRKILTHFLGEKTGVYFICGEVGGKGEDDLPEKILVCPAYGLDGFAVYKKEADYSAPGW